MLDRHSNTEASPAVTSGWTEHDLAPYGWFSLTIGPTLKRTYYEKLGDGAWTRFGEGEQVGGGPLALQYSRPIFQGPGNATSFSLRARIGHHAWSTPLSKNAGVGAYRDWDFGVGPEFDLAGGSKRARVILALAVPLSAVVTTVDQDPQRDVIEESWHTGYGYRVAVSPGIMVVMGRHFGLSTDTAVAWTETWQTIDFSSDDGSSVARTTRQLRAWDIDWSLGINWIP